MARGVWARGEGPGDGEGADGEAERRGGFEETHARRASRVAARTGTGDACGGEERGGEGQRRGGGGVGGIRDGWRGGGGGGPRGGAARGPRPRGRRRQPPNGFSRWNRRVPPGRTREKGAASIARPRTHRLLVAAVAHLERAGLVPARHRGARASAHRRRAGRRPRKQQRMPSQHHARATTGRSGACASARRALRSRPRTGRRRGLGPRARVAARECCARRPRQDEPRRARVWRRRRARRATTQPEGDLETRVFALALTKYPYAKGVYSGSEGKRNHPRAPDGWRER